MEKTEFVANFQAIEKNFHKRWDRDYYETLYRRLNHIPNNIIEQYIENLLKKGDSCPINLIKDALSFYYRQLAEAELPACEKEWANYQDPLTKKAAYCNFGIVSYIKSEDPYTTAVFPCKCPAGQQHAWMNQPKRFIKTPKREEKEENDLVPIAREVTNEPVF